jgi:hypothetical protein
LIVADGVSSAAHLFSVTQPALASGCGQPISVDAVAKLSGPFAPANDPGDYRIIWPPELVGKEIQDVLAKVYGSNK